MIGGGVRSAVDAGKGLSELSAAELGAQSPVLAAHEAGFREVLESSSWLESKVSEGGTSSLRLREQLELARAVLDGTA